jgi:hypothetical protein
MLTSSIKIRWVGTGSKMRGHGRAKLETELERECIHTSNINVAIGRVLVYHYNQVVNHILGY